MFSRPSPRSMCCLHKLFALGLPVLLVGCAGPGVGPTSPSPSPRTLTYASASAFETAEYNAQSGLALVKASSMY